MTDYIDSLETLTRKQLIVLLARQRQERTQAIAVTGMGCRFPGGIDTPDAFWAALRSGRAVPDEARDLPADSLGRPRWDTAAADLAPLTATLENGVYLDGVDLFDAGYFGLDAEEAVHLDPQQRLLLEVTVQALADANLTLDALRRRRVGVYVGLSTAEYNFAGLRNGLGKDDLSAYMGTGTALSAASGRIALALGVQGPVLTLDTACSSALTATHLAAAALRDGECDVALVGVSHLLLSPFTSEVFAKAGMVSPTGRCRPFTADADGYVRAEGCGVLVLERHRDAVEADRQPYAAIRGSAVHQYGDRPGMAAASAAGQRTVVELALERSGTAPHEVRYVEAQANGSRLGGVIEAETLAEVYRRREPGAPVLHLGSCKANLGYLETASGAAGLMKVALALAHGEIPPQPGADDPDPGISWDRTALKLPDRSEPWPPGTRRLAAVNAIGFTGTAAHVVMEGVRERPATATAEGVPALLALSGHTPEALAATAARLLGFLRGRAGWSYASVCRTLAECRDDLTYRHAAVVNGRDALLDELALAIRPGDRRTTPAGLRIDLRGGRRPHRLPFPALAEHLRPEGGADEGADDATAWVLAWTGLLAAAGITVAAALLDPADAEVLTPALTGARAGTAAPAGWELRRTAEGLVLRRTGTDEGPWTDAAEVDQAGWCELVAEAFLAGGRLDLGTVTPRPRPALCRLPGPALVGRRYWSDNNIWR